MKISLNWLNDYIQTGLNAEQIAKILSDLGFPCEGIEYLHDDAVIDVEVTSNRGDCLSYIGIARELAVATGKELNVPSVELAESQRLADEFASVKIIEPDLCGRYIARIIHGVKVGPSPDWMVKRLEAVGMRSVSNVVDATNYAMLETGQPPHAFDYDKIAGGKIIVRKALPGEQIVSIDGSRCQLKPDMLVIADTEKAVAVAGVMGGLDTEVSNATTTILLEDASFDPVSVRTTSRELVLPSDAAFRFERIVDIEMIDWASKRTAQLITQLAGGEVAKNLIDIYPKKPQPKKVTLRLSRLNKLLGIEVPSKEVVRILSALGFQPQQKGDLLVTAVPSWRHDVYREVDLIEEVVRVYGYDRIPTRQKIEINVATADKRWQLAQSVGTYLNGCGFYETINVTFHDDEVAELFRTPGVEEYLTVTDVSRKNANKLRQSLLGSLFAVLKTNLNVRNRPCRIYEIADTFVPSDKNTTLPIQKTKLALVCDSEPRDLCGVVEGLITELARNVQVVFTPAELSWAQAGAQISVDGRIIGTVGIVSDRVRQSFDFKEICPCGAELDFEMLLAMQARDIKLKPIPRFPAVERDLSVIVDESVRWADIAEAINKKAPNELEEVRFVGIYRGKNIPAQKKSVTLSLRFRDDDGTLTHEIVDDFEKDIVQSLAQTTGAKLRTV